MSHNFVQNSEFSTHFLRPSQIRISEASNIKAIVDSIKFLGAYYEVILNVNNIILKMYSFDKLSVSEEVRIEIIGMKFD